MIKDTGTSIKVSDYARSFNENLRCTRRAEINGKSVDKNKLSQCETWDLVVNFFKLNNGQYKELLKMEYVKNA